MARTPRVVVAGLLATALGAANPAGQSPPPITFRLEVNFVEISARVLDREGRFVPDLKQEDFRVIEDNKPQTIAAFGVVRVPLEYAEKVSFLPDPVESDVVDNTRSSGGRVYVLVLDDLHTDPSRTGRVKAAARKFIQENLGANDLAAVTVVGRSEASHELTTRRKPLLAVVEKFLGQGVRSSTLTKISEYNRQVGMTGDIGADVRDPFIQERFQNDRVTFRSLTRIAEWMGDIRGRRKALIYFGEGFGYDFRDVLRDLESTGQIVKPNLEDVFDNTRRVISAATRSDVNIYAVDPRGAGSGGDDMIEAASNADVNTPTAVDDPNFGNGKTNFRSDLGSISISRELEAAQDNLRTLSEQTGGFATLNSNDFATAYKRIVDENSAYYILGYYSNNTKRDGKYRKISVRLVNRPGVEVRARSGYLAARGKPEPAKSQLDSVPDTSSQIRELLHSPVPIAGIDMIATAAAFRGTPPNNTVVVTVEASAPDLRLVENNGRFVGDLSAVLAIVDAGGKLRASATPRLALGIKPETYRQIAEKGTVRIVSQFSLPPGEYQLRAALTASGATVGGNVQCDVDVPDFSTAPSSLSSVALVSVKANRSPVALGNAGDDRLPQPTAIREFDSDDQLGIYVEAYGNEKEPVHAVYVSTTVQARDGRVISVNEQQRTSQQLAENSHIETIVPLKDVAPGLYVLTVSARSGIGNSPPVSRVVPFRVR